MIDDANIEHCSIKTKYTRAIFYQNNVKLYYMADFQNQKERLKMFISSINLTNAAFEKSLGLSNGYINSMRKGLGYDKLEQISNLYTDLNMGWLLTGEGEMLKSSSPKEELSPITNERLLSIIESQQRTIENLSKK